MSTSRKHSLAMGVCLLTAAATALPLAAAAAATPVAPVLPGLADTVSELARTLDTRSVTAPVVPTTAVRDAASRLVAAS